MSAGHGILACKPPDDGTNRQGFTSAMEFATPDGMIAT